jgi:iron complex outermembrane receptor protein
MDVLRTVPGFDLTHSISTDTHDPHVRGQGNGHTITMMINGRSVRSDNGAAGYIFDSLPLESISRIEIIRGPGSALYGTGAFFGVINIITKKGGENPSEIGMRAGSYKTYRPYGELSYQDGDFNVYVYADYYVSDGYDGIIEADMTGRSGRMTPDEEYWNLQTNIGYKNFYFSGMLNYQENNNNSVGIAKILVDEDEISNSYASGEVGYKGPLGEKGNVTGKFFCEYYKTDRVWEIFPEEASEMGIHTGFPPGESPMGSPLAKYAYTGGEIQADYQIHSAVQLAGGALYEYWEVFDVEHFANYNSTNITLEIDGDEYYGEFPYRYFPEGMTDLTEKANWLDQGDRTIQSLYAQGIFDLKALFALEKWAKTLSLTAGIRYDRYDDMGSTLNPRGAVVWAPTEKLYFKGLYGTAFRAPSFFELYIKNNPSEQGNRDLGPEKNRTAELVAGYHFTPRIRGTLNWFSVKTKDLIQFVNREYKNVGKTEASGVEGELRFSFDRQKYAYLNFTRQEVTNTTNRTITSEGGKVYTQKDFDPGSYAKFMANIGVNYGFFDDRIIANVSVNYVGERDRTEEMVWAGEELAEADRDPVKDRTLVNACLTFRNFWKGWEFQVSGFNLFDADHRDPDPEGALYYDMPRPGRSFMASASYSF